MKLNVLFAAAAAFTGAGAFAGTTFMPPATTTDRTPNIQYSELSTQPATGPRLDLRAVSTPTLQPRFHFDAASQIALSTANASKPLAQSNSSVPFSGDEISLLRRTDARPDAASQPDPAATPDEFQSVSPASVQASVPSPLQKSDATTPLIIGLSVGAPIAVLLVFWGINRWRTPYSV